MSWNVVGGLVLLINILIPSDLYKIPVDLVYIFFRIFCVRLVNSLDVFLAFNYRSKHISDYVYIYTEKKNSTDIAYQGNEVLKEL